VTSLSGTAEAFLSVIYTASSDKAVMELAWVRTHKAETTIIAC